MKQLLLFILIPILSFGQNIIPDPGFELLRNCPIGISMLNASAYWYSPTQGTPDLFNKCSGKNSQVYAPTNVCGKQKPFDGKGYGGLILFESQYYDYKEYLQARLPVRMQKGAKYEIALHISLADNSMYAVDVIQVLFSEKAIGSNNYTTILYQKPQVTFQAGENKFFRDKKNWVLLKATYAARGNEQFMTIGTFLPNNRSNKKLVNKNGSVPSAYYFIDGISLVQVTPGEEAKEEEILPETDPEEEKDTLRAGRAFVLQNILFETDKDRLLPQSYVELNRLHAILLEYPQMKIEIQGHTDDRASAEHNLDLSQRRAKAVVNYLKSKDISPERLSWKGFGETRPIASNETEEGRSLNRRVEFMIVSME